MVAQAGRPGWRKRRPAGRPTGPRWEVAPIVGAAGMGTLNPGLAPLHPGFRARPCRAGDRQKLVHRSRAEAAQRHDVGCLTLLLTSSDAACRRRRCLSKFQERQELATNTVPQLPHVGGRDLQRSPVIPLVPQQHAMEELRFSRGESWQEFLHVDRHFAESFFVCDRWSASIAFHIRVVAVETRCVGAAALRIWQWPPGNARAHFLFPAETA